MALKTLFAAACVGIAGVHADHGVSFRTSQDPLETQTFNMRALAKKCDGWPGSVDKPRDFFGLGEDRHMATCKFDTFDVMFTVACTKDLDDRVKDGTLTPDQAAWINQVRAANLYPVLNALVPATGWEASGFATRAEFVEYRAKTTVPQCCDAGAAEPTGKCWELMGNLKQCSQYLPQGVNVPFDFKQKAMKNFNKCQHTFGYQDFLDIVGINGLGLLQADKLSFTVNCGADKEYTFTNRDGETEKRAGVFYNVVRECCLEKCLQSQAERQLEASAVKDETTGLKPVYFGDEALGQRCLSRSQGPKAQDCVEQCVAAAKTPATKPASAPASAVDFSFDGKNFGGVHENKNYNFGQLAGAGATSPARGSVLFAADGVYPKQCFGRAFQAAAQCLVGPCHSCVMQLSDFKHEDPKCTAPEPHADPTKAYNTGDKIKFEGSVFRARWWTTAKPNASNVGPLVQTGSEVWACECTYGETPSALCAQ